MENERATNICPRCNDTHFVHGPTGEVICDTCGLVIQTASLVVAEVFSRDGVSTGAKIPSNSLCSTSASKKVTHLTLLSFGLKCYKEKRRISCRTDSWVVPAQRSADHTVLGVVKRFTKQSKSCTGLFTACSRGCFVCVED